MPKVALILMLVGEVLCSRISLHAQSESLVIGRGDLIHVQVYDTPEFDQHPRVDDAGNVPLLFVGNVLVSGKTPAEAAAIISATFVEKHLMLHPEITVTMEQLATQGISVLGEVKKPGNYPISTPRSVIDVLSMAGGLSPTADRHITVKHQRSPKSPEIYYVANQLSNSIQSDVSVYPGDSVIVARAAIVYVLGDVARPGGYSMSMSDTPITLLQTLSQAGSPNRSATLSNVKLIRKDAKGYKETSVNVGLMEKGKRADIVMEADDVIFVPFSYAKNFVLTGTSVAASIASAVVVTLP